MNAISLDAAIVITERSKRTWWRRITDGTVTRLENDARGRAMLAFAEVASLICVPVQAYDLEMILRADAGDADAQADVGQMFSNAGKHEAARYWLQIAADQEHADAMQWLGRCYLAGEGVPKDENLGVMWIAKAAAAGHIIAQEQMRALIAGAKCAP